MACACTRWRARAGPCVCAVWVSGLVQCVSVFAPMWWGRGQRAPLLRHLRGAVRFTVVGPSEWNIFSSPSMEPIPSCSAGLRSTSFIHALTHSFIHSTKYGLSPPQTLPGFLPTARLASSLDNNDGEGPRLSSTNQVIARQALCSDFPSPSWLGSHDTPCQGCCDTTSRGNHEDTSRGFTMSPGSHSRAAGNQG